jgi:hypothetical protein
MLALLATQLAAQLLLIVSHDAAAHGQLRPLERYADRMELGLSLGQGNAISDSALAAIARWPALVAFEITPPLNKRDADRLGKLHRLAVRLPPLPAGSTDADKRVVPLRDARHQSPTLELLGAAMVRAERAQATPLSPGPCPGSDQRLLPDGSTELRIEGEISRCEFDWLKARLEPHSEPVGDLPPGMQPPPPKKITRAKPKKH